MGKWPNTLRSQTVLVVAALFLLFAWPKYLTYMHNEAENREDIKLKRELKRAEWVNEALKNKPYYFEWKKLEQK